MRLDLFLKNTRLVKRRTSAKRRALAGGFLVNDRPGKAGNKVKVGDVITLKAGDGTERRVRVLAEAKRPVPNGYEADFFEDVE